jgi:hypothetical protein
VTSGGQSEKKKVAAGVAALLAVDVSRRPIYLHVEALGEACCGTPRLHERSDLWWWEDLITFFFSF